MNIFSLNQYGREPLSSNSVTNKKHQQNFVKLDLPSFKSRSTVDMFQKQKDVQSNDSVTPPNPNSDLKAKEDSEVTAVISDFFNQKKQMLTKTIEMYRSSIELLLQQLERTDELLAQVEESYKDNKITQEQYIKEHIELQDSIKSIEYSISYKQKNINSLFQEVQKCEQQSKETYDSQYIEELYIPASSKEDLDRQVGQLGIFYNMSQFAKETSLAFAFIRELADKGVIDTTDVRSVYTYDAQYKNKTDLNVYILKNNPKNHKFIEEMRETKEHVISNKEISQKYDIPIARLFKYVKYGMCDCLYGIIPKNDEALSFFDSRNPKFQQMIDFHHASTPHKSSDYFISSENRHEYVRADKLLKLGFGTIDDIKSVIKSKKFPTKIVTVKSGNKEVKMPCVLISFASDSALYFKKLRDKNPNIIESKQLAQELGISAQHLQEELAAGKLDFIDEYMLADDYNDVYIRLNTQKTQEYVQKILFEHMIEELISPKTAKKSEYSKGNSNKNLFNSLRMKIVWEFCPETKKIASQLASGDAYLGKLFEKKDNNEDLTCKEQRVLNSYYKNLWNTAGLSEFKEGQEIATQALLEFKQGGIDAVSEPIAKDVIQKFIATRINNC